MEETVKEMLSGRAQSALLSVRNLFSTIEQSANQTADRPPWAPELGITSELFIAGVDQRKPGGLMLLRSSERVSSPLI